MAVERQADESTELRLLPRAHISAPTDYMVADWALLTGENEPCPPPESIIPRERNGGGHKGRTADYAVKNGAAHIATPIPSYRKRKRWKPKPDKTAPTRKERYQQRIAALRNVIEGILWSWGMKMLEAAEMAAWVVADRLKVWRKIAENWGYDYLACCWKSATI